MSVDEVTRRVIFSNPIFRKPERYLIERLEMIRKNGRPITEQEEMWDRQKSRQAGNPERMLQPH